MKFPPLLLLLTALPLMAQRPGELPSLPSPRDARQYSPAQPYSTPVPGTSLPLPPGTLLRGRSREFSAARRYIEDLSSATELPVVDAADLGILTGPRFDDPDELPRALRFSPYAPAPVIRAEDLLIQTPTPQLQLRPLPPGTNPPANPAPAAPPAPATPPAAADGTNKPTMEMSPAKLAVGEQGFLTIRVLDARGAVQSFPQTIEAEGLSIQFYGNSSQGYSRDGKAMQSVELQYRVEANAPGTITVPGQTLSIGGKSVTTNPIEVTVTEGQPIKEAIMPQAQLSVGKTELWEGEEVPVSVAILLHNSIQPTSQPLPVIKSEGVAVSRFDRHGRTEGATVGGEYWSAWRMPSSMIPIKSGEITFGPAEVKLDVLMPIGNAQRDPFGGFPNARRTMTIKSNTLKLRVKPLPTAGRPKDFSGLVGKFEIVARPDGQAGAGPQRVPLGDPVGFEISVTGLGNFDAVSAPALENGANLRPFKARVTMDSRSYGIEQGQKMFSQIIFPEKPGPASVVFVLPYFDPSTGTYLTAKSAPVELLVTGEPAAPATAPDAPAGSDARDFAAAVKIPVPGEDLNDILPNALDGGRWYSTTATLIPFHPWLLHGIPAAILTFLLGAGATRRYRAWALAHRPRPDAPRPCADIKEDLLRKDLSRLQFYGFVSEYVRAWLFWKRAPLPLDPALAGVLAARDHWLYATNAEPAAEPLPREEQSRAASVLTSQLSA